LALVAAIGDLRGYFFTAFLYPLLYSDRGSAQDVLHLAQVLFQGPLLPIVAWLIGLIVGTRHRRAGVLLVLVGLIFCMLPRREYGHYWVNFFPFVALLMGIALQEAEPALRRFRRVFVGMLVVLLWFYTLSWLNTSWISPSYLRYERVAQAADRLAPPGATLLVCGTFRSESIQFASHLPAANMFFAPFEFDPPRCDSLPRSFEEIRDDYLAHPPSVMVVEGLYLQMAKTAADPATLPNHLKLINSLLDTHVYRVAEQVEGFCILVRQP
jgi:hypothetical protein